MLHDIHIPVTKIRKKEELFKELPTLFETLKTNIGRLQNNNQIENLDERDEQSLVRENNVATHVVLSQIETRNIRLIEAWQMYDEASMAGELGPAPTIPPSAAIAQSAVASNIQEKHFEDWPVWNGETGHGTALIISHANEELQYLFEQNIKSSRSISSKDSFIQTLAGFVDPLRDRDAQECNKANPDLNYSVTLVKGGHRRELLGSRHEFSRYDTDSMEHVLSGHFDANGVFSGHVKAFGKWLTHDQPYVVQPKDIKIPHGCNDFRRSISFLRCNL